MHARYCFLLNLESSDPDDLKAEATREFESWLGREGDENNWSSVLVLITEKGDVLQLCEGGDWRCRDRIHAWVTEEIEKKRLKPFEWGKRFALDCCITDLGCFDLATFSFGSTPSEEEELKRLDALSFDEVVSETNRAASAKLSKMYAELAAGEEDRSKDWKRRSLARGYEMFRGASHVPFSYEGNPYDYRAFDLTHGEELGEKSAILIVDIHT